ncbi:MAG: NAD-binding protein [Actinomycetota bacterium]|nr:NAD-binding protein [Actinomycetota bacterium]
MARGWRDATDHVIVFGLRGLGVRIVEQLHSAGVEVVVVDDQVDRRLISVLEGWQVPRMVATPDLTSTLAAAGIAGARALIAVADDDLNTLEVALVAHNVRRDLRIVLRMVNTAVGGAVAEVTGSGTVLDVTALAAPSVVEACERQATRDLELGGETFTVLETSAHRSSTLRDLYGDLAPLAVITDDGHAVELCPGRDQAVEAGDRVVIIGAGEELDGLGPISSPVGRRKVSTRAGPRRVTLRRQATGAWRLAWSDATRPFRVACTALVALVVVSTIVLHLTYRRPGGLSLLDGLYFTVETVVTVGFGDFTYSSQSPWLVVFGIVLMIAGAGTVTALLALLTNVLVSRRIAETLGHRDVEQATDHVVVIGLGAIGLRVVEGLVDEGASVVVIERDDNNRNLARARALGVPILIADATTDSAIERANVTDSCAVAVMTSNDLTNIETGLAMRSHLRQTGHDIPIVLRVFDRNLGRIVERDFGFRYVRSTSALAAPWFVGAALGLDILSTFYVERELLLVARLTVAASGGLAGLAMQELPARLRVVAIARAVGGHLEHPPRRGTRFAPGDQAYVIGPYRELLVALRRDAEADAIDHADAAHSPSSEDGDRRSSR